MGKGKKELKVEVESVSGTRDFPPEDFRLREWLFSQWRAVARSFAFEEYDAPILERQELYKVKAGDAGEELLQQMYAFTDNSGQAVTLRPEMTPSLARLVIAKGMALLLPVRWFSIPQCWRYETLTRGRKHEHFQWNMDILGVPDVTAEAELLAAIVAFFQRVGLRPAEVKLRVSSRQLIQAVLQELGVPESSFNAVCIVVDKLDKLAAVDVLAELAKLGLTQTAADRLIAALAPPAATETTASALARAEALFASPLSDEEKKKSSHDSDSENKKNDNKGAALASLRELFALCDAYGIGEWVRFDASVVRGLAYYTGVVFEATAVVGEVRRAICGGGRYDRLLGTYGAPNVPACGFGFGDVVVLEILKDLGRLPALKGVVDDVVVPYDESMRPVAVRVAAALRAQGRAVDLVMGKKKKMQWIFSYADRVSASRAVFVAPDEWAQGEKVQLKMLRLPEGDSRKQRMLTLQELIELNE